jgi:hypothetical protein
LPLKSLIAFPAAGILFSPGLAGTATTIAAAITANTFNDIKASWFLAHLSRAAPALYFKDDILSSKKCIWLFNIGPNQPYRPHALVFLWEQKQ